MVYTAVIRTLGTAGEKYRQLLDSLVDQSVPPAKIIVYIAEGYALPKETVGCEEYVYVRKGMVAQRALPYKEVDTEYILFLDDDVFLPQDGVEKLYQYMADNGADVISPDVFPNADRPWWSKLTMAVSGRMMARKDDGRWGYKVMRNAGYSYNSHPKPGVYWSQTNAGPCFFCSKENFLKIHFEEELWMDQVKYALGDDQVMFYKMYLAGLKQLTWFHSGIRHLDAGTSLQQSDQKKKELIYSDFRFKTIFWHRFIYLPETALVLKAWDAVCIGYALALTLLISLVKADLEIVRLKWKAIKDAVAFIRSDEYRRIPKIHKKI